jgi:hypothetical protein
MTTSVFLGSLKHVPILETNMPAALFSKRWGLQRSVNKFDKVRDWYTMFGEETVLGPAHSNSRSFFSMQFTQRLKEVWG